MNESSSGDWIELFLSWTERIPSPALFRQWAAISCLAGALERRVWMNVAGKVLYPNLYVLLVASPGVGKTQAIEHTNDLWLSTRDLHVAPHDLTKAALIDALAAASRKLVLGESALVEYNSLLVAADEFGVLVPSHDLDFLNTLNRIFDNPPQHRQNRRGLSQQIDIINPQLNIIGGVQPAYLANLLPEEAWGMGFMSRVIMIYSAEKKKISLDLFGPKSSISVLNNSTVRNVLLAQLKTILKLHGQILWTQEAADAAEDWNLSGLEPAPTHTKLEHYINRRLLHCLKLSLISSVSAGHSVVELSDFTRARDWLLEAEIHMPDIFREMVQRSDTQVLDELHFFAWKIFIKEKKPIHASRLIHFLRNRVPSEKILRILDISVRANIFDRMAGTEDMYKPRPQHEHGIE